jgi:hypothetical protein
MEDVGGGDLDELLRKIGPGTWWSTMRRALLRLSPRELRRQVRWGIQRWRRGYSDCDVWSLDHYFASVIPPAFRQLRSELHGVPGHMIAKHGGDADAAEAEWREILEKIAAGFEAWLTIFDTYPRGEENEALQRQFDEGARLFVEHYGAFWD